MLARRKIAGLKKHLVPAGIFQRCEHRDIESSYREGWITVICTHKKGSLRTPRRGFPEMAFIGELASP